MTNKVVIPRGQASDFIGRLAGHIMDAIDNDKISKEKLIGNLLYEFKEMKLSPERCSGEVHSNAMIEGCGVGCDPWGIIMPEIKIT